jgi:hypothetical protein
MSQRPQRVRVFLAKLELKLADDERKVTRLE